MACFHPSTVSVSRKSGAKPGLRVQDQVTVPCGHCGGCRADQARSWAIRLLHESEYPPRPAWFVTLTYDPENVPENGTLQKEDPTLFLKRLRSKLARQAKKGLIPSNPRVSYYLCGEYGETTDRPHYHLVLYGPHLLDRDTHTTRHGAPVFISPTLSSTWGLGFVEFTGLTYAAARYVAGYVRKKVRASDAPEAYSRFIPESGEIIEIEREYATMSRRPAIATRWLERYWRDVYPRDFVTVDGHELKPPRYYDRWMDQTHNPDIQSRPCSDCRHHQEVMYNVRRARIEAAVEIEPETLRAKEKIHEARVNLFQGRKAV